MIFPIFNMEIYFSNVSTDNTSKMRSIYLTKIDNSFQWKKRHWVYNFSFCQHTLWSFVYIFYDINFITIVIKSLPVDMFKYMSKCFMMATEYRAGRLLLWLVSLLSVLCGILALVRTRSPMSDSGHSLLTLSRCLGSGILPSLSLPPSIHTSLTHQPLLPVTWKSRHPKGFPRKRSPGLTYLLWIPGCILRSP